MRRIQPWVGLFVFFILCYAAMAQELTVGKDKRKYIPPDKIVFREDFSRCPVGEPPAGFEKVSGAGECVKLESQIWIAPASDGDYRVYKKLNLGRDEFSVEFDYLPYQDMSGAIGPKFIFRFLESRGTAWDKAKPPYDLEINGTYNMCVFKLERTGKIGERKNCHRKKVHVILQVRRGQLRVYVDGKRLSMVPFELTSGEHISGFELMFVGDTRKYGELVSRIKVGKYTTVEEKPRPEKLGIEVQETAQGIKFTVPEKILFDFNRFFLKKEAKEALHLVAEVLRERPYKKVLIIGYTDNVGSDEYNLRLSLQRAQSVADYLIYVEGIDCNRMRIEGRGKANPVADNSTEEGRAKNRRVEIVILE